MASLLRIPETIDHSFRKLLTTHSKKYCALLSPLPPFNLGLTMAGMSAFFPNVCMLRLISVIVSLQRS